jgi:hypothetical protein
MIQGMDRLDAKQKRTIKGIGVLLILILGVIRGIDLFNPTQPGTSLNSNCSLDSLDGAVREEGSNTFIVSKSSSTVTFQGWISNVASSEAPNKVSISIADDKNYIQLTEHSRPDFPRPDVVKAFNSTDQMLLSGFNVPLSLSSLSPGTYSALMEGEYSGNRILCSKVVSLEVKE